MPDEEDVRGWLAAVEVPPSRLEVSRIVRTGRSRARRRRYAAAGGTAAAVLAAAAVAPAALDLARGPDAPPGPVLTAPPSACEAERLPGSEDRTITAADPTGRYLLDQIGPTLWIDGRPAELDYPYETEIWGGVVVNSSGTIAGTAVVDGRMFAWVYEDGEFTELPGRYVEVRDIAVYDINEAGDILGEVSEDGQLRPAVWPASDRESVRVLPLPDGYQADDLLFASAIDDDQTVVGTHHILSTERRRAVTWSPDGTVSELPVPDEFGPDYTSGTTDIRGGWVAGSVYDPAGGTSGVTRWHLPSGEITIGSGLSEEWAINAQGWLAGTVGESQFDQRPAIEVDGQVIELPYPPGLEPMTSDWASDWGGQGPLVISDDGRTIAGNVVDSDTGSGYVSVRWTCR